MEQCLSSDAKLFTSKQEIARNLRKPKAYYRFYKTYHLSLYWALLHDCS